MLEIETTEFRDLQTVLANRVAHCPDKPWILTARREFSYREMDGLSGRLAQGMIDIGLAHGDTVLIMMPDTIDFILAWCALSKFGGIEVPVNVHNRGNPFAYLVNDSLARVMIIDVALVDRVEAVADQLENLERLVLYDAGEPCDSATKFNLPESISSRFEILHFGELFADRVYTGPAPAYHDLMGIMYTSGTTGPSKGVTTSHAHAYEYAYGIIEMLELKEDDIYCAPLPLFHIAGQFATVYASCIAGATAVISGPFSIERFWKDIADFDVTCTFLLGAMANFIYRQPESPGDADSPLERALVVPLIPEVEDFKRRFGCLVSTTWGGTEMNCPTRSGFELANNRTCGRVAEDRYEVRIVDELDCEVAPGVPGEALVRAKVPWIMTNGYWNHPEWTEKAWRNLWHHTGDMLMYDEEGNLYFVDRVKDAIRRRGENISSMEVENEINSHPAVLESAVLPVPAEETEEEVMAVLVLRDGKTVDPGELIRYLEPRMAYFMIPRYIEVVDALPKTATGKIQKFALRDAGVGENTWDRVAAGVKLER